MLRHLPPSAAALGYPELRKAVSFVRRYGDCTHLFEERLRDYLGVRYVFPMSSGRASLTVLLRAVRKLYGGTKVVVPDYTCYSVPSAVAKAGLTIAPVDIDPHTLDYDLERLSHALTDDVLAVVAVHPYGIPCSIGEIESLCGGRGIAVIDDAAQALGGKSAGRMLGTFGDAAILSFGRGKPMTTINGGAVLTNSERAAEAVGEVLAEESCLGGSGGRYVLPAAAYPLFTHPMGFALARKLPFLEIGVTRFDIDYRMSALSGFQAAIGAACIEGLDRQNALRRQNAGCLQDRLYALPGLRVVTEREGDCAVYLRQPVVFDSSESAERVYSRLTRLGLGASRAYPGTVSGISEASAFMRQGNSHCSASHSVSQRIVTLPTHHLVTPTDIYTIAKVLQEELTAVGVPQRCGRSAGWV